MHRVVVERSAEKDLKRLSSEIRTRAVAAIQALAKNPGPLAAGNWPEPKAIGEFASAITASFTKSRTKFALSASTACVTAATFTDEALSLVTSYPKPPPQPGAAGGGESGARMRRGA